MNEIDLVIDNSANVSDTSSSINFFAITGWCLASGQRSTLTETPWTRSHGARPPYSYTRYVDMISFDMSRCVLCRCCIPKV